LNNSNVIIVETR